MGLHFRYFHSQWNEYPTPLNLPEDTIAGFASYNFILMGMRDGVEREIMARPQAELGRGQHAKIAGVSAGISLIIRKPVNFLFVRDLLDTLEFTSN